MIPPFAQQSFENVAESFNELEATLQPVPID